MAYVRYIIKDTYTTKYRIFDSESGKIREVDKQTLIKYRGIIENINHATSDLDIKGAIEIKIKNMNTYSGRLLEGFNDFDTFCRMNDRFDLLEEYKAGKNTKKTTEISRGSLDKVTWVCNKCGHTWQTPIKSRTVPTISGRPTGCPRCAMQSNI